MRFEVWSILFLAITCFSQRTRKSKQIESRTTVVSCRVFRQGVCKKSSENIITVNKSITNSANCQQFCYSTPGCSAFTHFEESSEESRKCVLFKDCNGKLSDCKDCISGPIMPRITECLAAKQEVAPTTGTKKPCTFGCAGVCVGPLCPELISGIQSSSISELDTEARFGPSSESKNNSTLESKPNVQGETDYNSYDDAEVTIDEDIFEEYDDEYADTYEATPDSVDIQEENESDNEIEESFFEAEDNFETETMNDEPLEIEEEMEDEEEVADEDINIDSGFLNDDKGNTVELPRANPQPSSNAASSPTFIFFFCAMGGMNHNGAVTAVDILSSFTKAIQAMTITPMPSQVIRGGEVSAAYTGRAITSCSNGYSTLSPYGYLYKPGSCYDYNLNSNSWKQTGAKLTTYRKGGTLTKMGKYLMATGGQDGKRSLRSIELFDPKRPEKGWKQMGRMNMPTSVSEHCTVALKGSRGQEVIITGGKGRENRALKLDTSSNKWYSLNRLNNGRRKHACVKATLNGRVGIVVSGGENGKDSNMTSVEFYDTETGSWFNLPSLRRGRQNHAMVINKGKLMVAGGMGEGRKGKEYLDDIEIFTGQRWVVSSMKLDQPRAGFSLVKIPRLARSVSSKPRGAANRNSKMAPKKITPAHGHAKEQEKRGPK